MRLQVLLWPPALVIFLVEVFRENALAIGIGSEGPMEKSSKAVAGDGQRKMELSAHLRRKLGYEEDDQIYQIRILSSKSRMR